MSYDALAARLWGCSHEPACTEPEACGVLAARGAPSRCASCGGYHTAFEDHQSRPEPAPMDPDLAPVDIERAKEAALRLIRVAFRKTDENGEPIRPNFRIPRTPNDDDAIILRAIRELERERRRPVGRCFHADAGKPCTRYFEGAAGERAAIVEWLRWEATHRPSPTDQRLREAADAIEGRVHDKPRRP